MWQNSNIIELTIIILKIQIITYFENATTINHQGKSIKGERSYS